MNLFLWFRINYSRKWECFDQSCVNRTETVHGTFSFLFLSHLLYGICVKIFINKSIYFKELHNDVACERQTFLLAHRCWATFREEERLWLSERNSILMTQNLSRIWSEELIGQRSSVTVSTIVYEWQTKDKRRQRSNVNVMNL